MENNPYQFILQTLEVAEQILLEAENLSLNQIEKSNRFLALVLLEAVIDKERVFVPAGASGELPEIKQQMEERFNQFRTRLGNLGKTLNPEELKSELSSLGDSLKTVFLPQR